MQAKMDVLGIMLVVLCDVLVMLRMPKLLEDRSWHRDICVVAASLDRERLNRSRTGVGVELLTADGPDQFFKGQTRAGVVLNTDLRALRLVRNSSEVGKSKLFKSRI